MKWFRLYNEVLDDPKVQQLPPELFKCWINILCIASKNDGKLPDIKAIAYHIRASESATQSLLDALLEAQLLQEFSNQHGKWLAPHSWQKRQYKSDTSSERVKRYRNAKKAVTETASESDTDTDTESKKKKDEFLCNFDVETHLDDRARTSAKKKAPGWDLYHLIPIFNEMIRSGTMPDNPAGAFIVWCGKYTKGKQL